MADIMWRQRLRTALDDSGKSKRAVSLGINAGPGYVHSILNEGKDPTVNKLLALCEELGVSASWVLYGLEVRPEDQEVLRALQQSPEVRQNILALLHAAGG